MNGNKTVAVIVKILAFLVMLGLATLFFTNDFGLIDIHKTSIVMAVGVDVDGDDLLLTAQVAVPRPSQSGDAVEYVEIQGSGATVSDAVDEVYSKAGFYPKLMFCKIVLLGESCAEKDIFRILDFFYRNEYAQLTPLVAMCKGKASEMLAMPTPASDAASMPLEKVLSEELKKSAAVSTTNLKLIAQDRYSQSGACFMPYIEANVQGTSEPGSGAGGETPPPSEGSGGGDQPSNSSGGSSESSGKPAGGEQKPVEFTCRKTAFFQGGNFAGILSEDEAFAFNLVRQQVNHATVTCKYDGKIYSLGLKDNKGDIKLKVKDGAPKLILSFEGTAEILEISEDAEPDKSAAYEKTPESVLDAAQQSVRNMLYSLVERVKESDCDILGARTLLYKYANKYYEAFKDNLLSAIMPEFDINIKSAN